MNFLRIVLLLSFISLLPAQSPRERIVVLISLDGFPADSLDDPDLPIPTIRRLIREGAVAERMSVSNPSVTWPNHTTLVTGEPASRHGVLFNGLLIREPQSVPRLEPWRDKKEMVRVPTIYDRAFEAGLTTAQVDWVPTLNAGTIHWEFKELPDADGPVSDYLMEAGLITRQELENFRAQNIVWRDQQWTSAAVTIIERHRPNLLLLHLLTLDSTHHTYGPGSRAALTAFAFLDGQVARILEALSRAGLQDKATLFVVSDHGFKSYHHRINPNALLLRLGLLEQGGADQDPVNRPLARSARAYVIPEGGTALVYVTRDDPGNSMSSRLMQLFASMLPGLGRIYEPAEFPQLGLPFPEENDQAPVLVLSARDGYTFGGRSDGEVIEEVEGGSHGYPASDPDMDGLFVAWGWGIRPGVRLDRVRNFDVAPTIATLLGLDLGEVEGESLTSILSLSAATPAVR